MTRSSRDSETVSAEAIDRYDAEVDVLVVGFGCAGACAAIEAADAGAETLVLERAGGAGGTSALSGGILYLGGGTPVQQACGFEDDPDAMAAFLAVACGPSADTEKIRRYCQDSVEHFHWLVAQDVPFKPSFYPEPNMESPTDDCLVFTGGEDTWPFDEFTPRVARGHKPQHEAAAGGFLMQQLEAAVQRRGVAVECNVSCEQLVVEGNGRVVGCVGRRAGELFRARARRGVVLCAGGFVLDDEMIAHHAPQAARCSWRLSNGNDDGRAIRMGQAAGAETIHMGSLECAIPLTPPRRMLRGIFVDRSGQRFINEDSYYGRIGQKSLFELGGHFFWIHDEETYEVNDAEMQATWVAESIPDLETEMALPAGSLVSSVALYNEHAARGEDPLFHKGREFLKPLVAPPFAAIEIGTEQVTYATFTLGGLHTKADGEVLTPEGKPVPGLYAAGRTTSGIAALGYVSGISLGDASFFGRLAGRSAARS